MRKHPQRKHCSLCARWCRTKAGICAPCAYYIRHAKVSPSWDLGLRDGHWVRRRGIQVWVADKAHELGGRPVKPLLLTVEEMKRGYSQYRQGARTDFAITAYREYQRAWKRNQRARAA